MTYVQYYSYTYLFYFMVLFGHHLYLTSSFIFCPHAGEFMHERALFLPEEVRRGGFFSVQGVNWLTFDANVI